MRFTDMALLISGGTIVHCFPFASIYGSLYPRCLRCASAVRQDKFFTQLKSSADGFNVIAEFFGRGLLNNTSASAPA